MPVHSPEISLPQIEPLLLGRAVRLQQLDRAEIQQRAQRPAHAGRVPHLDDRGRERHRQPLAAIIGIALQPHPSGFDIALIGLAETGRGADDAVFEHAADTVGRLVQRVEFGGGETGGLAEDRVGDIALDSALQRCPASGVRIEHEAHFFDGSGIGHGGSLASPGLRVSVDRGYSLSHCGRLASAASAARRPVS